MYILCNMEGGYTGLHTDPGCSAVDGVGCGPGKGRRRDTSLLELGSEEAPSAPQAAQGWGGGLEKGSTEAKGVPRPAYTQEPASLGHGPWLSWLCSNYKVLANAG